MNGFDTLSVITRSPVRPRVLRCLLERGPAETAELVEHVDASRRTVSRTLTALEEEGLVAVDGRTYRATTYGELFADELFAVLDGAHAHREFAAFLDAFPTDAVDVSFESIDGTTTLRRESHPHAPVSRIIETLSGSDRVRVLAPVASPLYVRPLVARIGAGATVEAVVDERAYDEFCTRLRTGVRLASKLTDVTLTVHEDVPFGLLECDAQTVFGAYEDGVLQATFETSAETARDAGRETFRRYRRNATVVAD
ncbi:helix-turn-helix transcriptional regulator [Natrarchaeobius sp. A-rgal3]|uniref:helix-turn-helix transcriptional regulator n=1 Tax=Natrarchaeobius versutus TaxID=1679078 RepID=UPI003510C8B0